MLKDVSPSSFEAPERFIYLGPTGIKDEFWGVPGPGGSQRLIPRAVEPLHADLGGTHTSSTRLLSVPLTNRPLQCIIIGSFKSTVQNERSFDSKLCTGSMACIRTELMRIFVLSSGQLIQGLVSGVLGYWRRVILPYRTYGSTDSLRHHRPAVRSCAEIACGQLAIS